MAYSLKWESIIVSEWMPMSSVPLCLKASSGLSLIESGTVWSINSSMVFTFRAFRISFVCSTLFPRWRWIYQSQKNYFYEIIRSFEVLRDVFISEIGELFVQDISVNEELVGLGEDVFAERPGLGQRGQDWRGSLGGRLHY